MESERDGLFHRKQTTKHEARQSTFERGQSSILAPRSPRREKEPGSCVRFNSFLEGSEADARSFIFMELDHKRDQARCSVICHQTARMQCPNMERMSCPKHLFLAVSFPASRSELQLSDKQRSWTPSPAHSSPPPGVGTLLPGPVCSSSPRLSPAGTAVIFDLGYVYTKSLPRCFSHPFVPPVGPGLLSLPLSCWCF